MCLSVVVKCILWVSFRCCWIFFWYWSWMWRGGLIWVRLVSRNCVVKSCFMVRWFVLGVMCCFILLIIWCIIWRWSVFMIWNWLMVWWCLLMGWLRFFCCVGLRICCCICMMIVCWFWRILWSFLIWCWSVSCLWKRRVIWWFICVFCEKGWIVGNKKFVVEVGFLGYGWSDWIWISDFFVLNEMCY